MKDTENMSDQATSKYRKKRFKSMSSDERKALIRKKMKAEGLQEGSGVPGKDLSSYDRDEIWELIQITHFFSELKAQKRNVSQKTTRKPNRYYQ